MQRKQALEHENAKLQNRIIELEKELNELRSQKLSLNVPKSPTAQKLILDLKNQVNRFTFRKS